MAKPANERNQLRKWIAALDNGADLQFVPMDPGGTAGDMPLDAAEVFASRGIAPGEGTWFGWDRVGDSNAFAAGQLVGPLCLWADGDLDRIADLLVEALPDEYEIAVGDDLLQISRGPGAHPHRSPRGGCGRARRRCRWRPQVHASHGLPRGCGCRSRHAP